MTCQNGVLELSYRSDAVYMTPPFLSAYGLMTDNQTLLQEAYDQCRLYREALMTDEQLLQHIALGEWQDEGLWTTGNAWAAAGMLRTAQTIARSQFGGQMASQIGDLQQWTVQLVSQAWRWRNLITGLLVRGLYLFNARSVLTKFVQTHSRITWALNQIQTFQSQLVQR